MLERCGVLVANRPGVRSDRPPSAVPGQMLKRSRFRVSTTYLHVYWAQQSHASLGKKLQPTQRQGCSSQLRITSVVYCAHRDAELSQVSDSGYSIDSLLMTYCNNIGDDNPTNK